jgi:D-alanine-D-alanine ligase
MRVAVLAGGRSSERAVSLSTAEVIRDALEEAGHEVVPVVIERTGSWSANGAPLLLSPGDGLLDCEVVFPALHGAFGEDGTVQGLLELLDVPYVGAGVLASSLCMDKAAFKEALAASGVAQARHVVIREPRWRSESAAVEADVAALGMPVFVKPARLGSSVGVVKVTDPGRVRAALETAFSYDGVVVVEQHSPGIEVECGVIGLHDPEASIPGQIVLAAADWYDYDAKYTREGYRLVAPPNLPGALVEEVRELARETFVRVGCAGLARVDFFVEGDRVLVNEVNTLPGFTPTSDFPKLWEASGVPLPALCDRLIELAQQRFRTERVGHAF